MAEGWEGGSSLVSRGSGNNGNGNNHEYASDPASHLRLPLAHSQRLSPSSSVQQFELSRGVGTDQRRSCSATIDHSVDPVFSPGVLQAQVQGFDYDFFPSLDPKYECPICLLCQREPTQTSCGHRFCRSCIRTWISMEGRRCPEDNSPITEHDLFPDNFAKREIMSLLVRCPNKAQGCLENVELGKIEDHMRGCEFHVVPCPNQCSMTMLRRDVNTHKSNECLRRTISCKLCNSDFPLSDQQNHFAMCPMVTVPCTRCGTLLPRQQLERHTETDCPKQIVLCPFYEVGCTEQLERNLLVQHVESSTQLHLQMLTSAFRTFQFHVGKALQTGDSGSRVSSLPPIYNSKDKLGEFGIDQEKGDKAASYLDTAARCTPPFTIGSNAELPLHERTSDEHVNSLDKIVTSPSALGMLDKTSLTSPPLDWLKDLYQRNVQLEQKAREQELKLDALRQRVAENERIISTLMAKQTSSETRFCNGVYFWSVPNFSRLRLEASRGHNRVLHSPGFYTSCFGYRVCLRLNVQGKDNSAFVSLFIHLMEGEFDDLLDWPFNGKITLHILDQVDRSETKADITETMHTKPGLTAFRRPTAERNPKGFGYTEFVSVESLLSGPYLKNDTIIIKAVVSL